MIGDNGPASEALLGFAAGLALDSSGNLYIADSQSLRVRKVTAATGIISTVAGNGTSGTTITDGSSATNVGLNSPSAVAVDNNNNVFIANSFLGTVLEVSGGLISNFAGNGTLGYSGDRGPAISAEIGTSSAWLRTPAITCISRTTWRRIRPPRRASAWSRTGPSIPLPRMA